MFNTSLRRVARSYPTAPSIQPRPTTPSIAASFTSHSHQRRQSSSKPPVPPNNGSNPIAAASVKTVSTPRTKDVGDKRQGAESRLSKRRIAREKSDIEQIAQSQWTANLPSVPSTQHLSPNDVCLASFFSIHRPISITSPFPTQISPEDFEKIFTPKPKTSRSRPPPNEVIYTISTAVEDLDESIAEQQNTSQREGVKARADFVAAITQHNNNATPSNSANSNQPQHLDSQPQGSQLRVPRGVKIVIEEVARRFRPFNVPPPPQAISDAELDALEIDSQEDKQASEQVQRRIPQRDNYTVHEITETPDGGFSVEIEEPSTSSILHNEHESEDFERNINSRRGRSMLDRRRWRNKMYAISVKRQRKLKMKKHKYKKLMRKTRNLRRRQDKL